jgi:hypothetical protein
MIPAAAATRGNGIEIGRASLGQAKDRTGTIDVVCGGEKFSTRSRLLKKWVIMYYIL